MNVDHDAGIFAQVFDGLGGRRRMGADGDGDEDCGKGAKKRDAPWGFRLGSHPVLQLTLGCFCIRTQHTGWMIPGEPHAP